jgi:hypothetical protein
MVYGKKPLDHRFEWNGRICNATVEAGQHAFYRLFHTEIRDHCTNASEKV